MDHSLQIAHFHRPARGESACGDALEVFLGERTCTVLVVDGLGHGPRAAEAAEAAVVETRRALEARPEERLEEILQRCHRALAGTRGAAVAVCRLDPDRGRLLFAGVGNVGLTVWPERKGVGVSLPGVVGYRVRKIRVFETEVGAGDTVALFTDGISSRFSLRDYADLPVEELVTRVAKEHGKDHDDATLVVLRVGEAAGGPGEAAEGAGAPAGRRGAE